MIKPETIRILKSPLRFIEFFFKAVWEIRLVFAAILMFFIISGVSLYYIEPTCLNINNQSPIIAENETIEEPFQNDMSTNCAVNKAKTEEKNNLNELLMAVLNSIELAVTVSPVITKNIYARLIILFNNLLGLVFFGLIVYIATVVTGPLVHWIKTGEIQKKPTK